MKIRVGLGIVALLLGAAAPAAGEHGGIHPTFRRQPVFFHCNGSTKVANVNALAEGSYPSWDATAPAQSVAAGAGCGALDPGVVRAGAAPVSPWDGVWVGSFGGNVRELTVQLHNLLLSQARTGATTFTLRVRMTIDGQEVTGTDTMGRMVTLTPVISSTGLSELMEFSITNLGFAVDVFDPDGRLIDVETAGLATEDGDGSAERQFVLAIDTEDSFRNSAWVWDTTEVPAGIVFNPTTLAAAKLTADLPGGGG